MNEPLTGVADESFAECPRECDVPADLHHHFEREPGVYFRLAAPLPCCGREWMREDEMLILDQCQWCWKDHGTLVPGVCVRLVYPTARPTRDAKRRRR
jgi:hypothetical protein